MKICQFYLGASALACVSAIALLFFFSCKKNTPLSPARNISGTWTTPAAVTFYMMSNGCGSFARYNSTPVSMRWEITTVSDSVVDIYVYSTNIGHTTNIGSNCGLPASLVFPLHFTGYISSSNMVLNEKQMIYSSSGAAQGLGNAYVGTMNFTTNNLTGTIMEKDCPAYCSGFQTDANTCILTR